MGARKIGNWDYIRYVGRDGVWKRGEEEGNKRMDIGMRI